MVSKNETVQKYVYAKIANAIIPAYLGYIDYDTRQRLIDKITDVCCEIQQ